MNKKSIFFTLSLFLLVTSVLSLSFLIFNYTYRGSVERTVELSALDRVSDLSGSIEKSLVELLNLSFKDSALIEENPDGTTNVTVSEFISRVEGELDSEEQETLETFEDFVEQKDNYARLDIEAIENKELPLFIIPHNITYTRNWQIGHVTLNVIPQEINFGSLDIVIDTGNIQIESSTSQLRTEGDFYFSVKARDSYGFNIVEEKFVDPSDNHQVQVFFVDGNKVKITLKDNELEIWTNSANPIEITTTMDNLEKMNESVKANYIESAISVTLPGLGISKVRPLVLQ